MTTPITVTQILGVGSLLTLIGGSLLAWGKTLPGKIWTVFLNQFTVSATVRDTDPMFPSLLLYTQKQIYMQKCRKLLVQSENMDVDNWGSSLSDAKNQKEGFLFTRAPGNHLFQYKNHWVFFTRQVDDKKTGVSRNMETIYLRVLGRDRAIFEQLFQDSKKEIEEKFSRQLSIRVSNQDANWSIVRGCRKRDLDSVVLADGLGERVTKDIRRFLDSEKFYLETGTPYHRGYLLEGPPGGGKSSFVQALATHFDTNLYVLCLGEIRTDEQLRVLMNQIPENSFLLIEDIDAVDSTHARKEDDDKPAITIRRSEVTLGGLLNVLDGVFAKHQLVVFMTTNHPEKLDPALVRAGRIDFRVHLGYASVEQARKLYLKFFPRNGTRTRETEADTFSEQAKRGKISMAELQEQLVSDVFGDSK